MKIESIGALIDWIKNVHLQLAEAFAAGARKQQDGRAKELLVYLASSEKRLGNEVSGYEEKADSKALHTRVYDFEVHSTQDITRLHDQPYGAMSYDDIAQQVFGVHQQITDFCHYLIGRAAIPEERELLEALLSVEEQETKQMSQQVNRGHDL